jgi:hypothetical protein
MIFNRHSFGWYYIYYELFATNFIILQNECLRYILPNFDCLQLLFDIFRYHPPHSIVSVYKGLNLCIVSLRILVALGDQVTEEPVLSHFYLAVFSIVIWVEKCNFH